MKRLLLFDLPQAMESQAEELKEILKPHDGKLLLQVELAFSLMELLNLDDEPVTGVWAALSGMPIRDQRIQELNESARLALANTRQIVPFSARSAWNNALVDYLEIPISQRIYDFKLTEKDPTLINRAKVSTQAIRQKIYKECLTTKLSYRQRKIKKQADEGDYFFEAKLTPAKNLASTVPGVPVSFSKESIQNKNTELIQWFPPESDKKPFKVSLEALKAVASWLSVQEDKLHDEFQSEKQGWKNRKIQYQLVSENQELERQEHLILDGFTHLAGMVASGKSTLAHLLAAYTAKECPEKRLTIIVGDTLSAFKMANQINWWFFHDPRSPENEAPIAVPLFGRSTREERLKEFYSSADYLNHCKRGQPHWGERWLSTLCPLQALIEDNVLEDQFQQRFLKSGHEPCQKLAAKPKKQEEKDFYNQKISTDYSCPYIKSCPQYQIYRDMPTAKIWITTPGAMSSGSLPPQWESRPIKIGELIYEQSDVVIFDEVDTIIKWFDDAYADEIKLTNGSNGLFDSIALTTEKYSIENRVMPRSTQRWVGAERNVQQSVSAVLTLLDPYRGKEFLIKWVGKRFFTPNALFYKLSRRIAGLEEFDAPNTSEKVKRHRQQAAQKVFGYFDKLIEGDPLKLKIPARNAQGEPVYRLSQIAQRINSTGDSPMDPTIHEECIKWISRFFPDTEDKLLNLKADIETSKFPRRNNQKYKGKKFDHDTLNSLAYRLQFALSVALLDFHSRTVFYEWENRPTPIQDSSPQYRNSSVMQEILPLPLTGRQFGTYYSKGEQDDRNKTQKRTNLSLFAYTNIGRHYVLNFHRLLTDFTANRGPNVLALSGTSYLPDSTSLHVGKPKGVLLPSARANKAIAKSKFFFLPQQDSKNQPIRISGRPENQKPGLFSEIAAALAGKKGNGILNKTLSQLTQSGRESPVEWADRDRLLLLVNSYEQASWAARELRQKWPSMQNSIKYLVPDKEKAFDSEDKTLSDKTGVLRRSDVEKFASSDSKILVAPISAIGRGFNILNSAHKAAFGAVFFLTRPYPHPHDTKAIAQEMNRRAFDWVEDKEFSAWEKDGFNKKADALRRAASQYWQSVENRSYYHTLKDIPELRARPRADLAATTIGHIVQAVGRLLRGGVPFLAYFVDGAWGPNNAKTPAEVDSPSTSLLAAMIQVLNDYVAEDKICEALYDPLAKALDNIENFQWEPDHK